MTILGLVLAVLVLFVLIWAVQTLAVGFGIPDPIRVTIMVLIVLVFVLWIVNALGGFGYGPVLRVR